MTEETIVRENLMNEKGYAPYCGSDHCEYRMARAPYDHSLEQFRCPCGWISAFHKDFIDRYKAKWGLVKFRKGIKHIELGIIDHATPYMEAIHHSFLAMQSMIGIDQHREGVPASAGNSVTVSVTTANNATNLTKEIIRNFQNSGQFKIFINNKKYRIPRKTKRKVFQHGMLHVDVTPVKFQNRKRFRAIYKKGGFRNMRLLLSNHLK